MNSERMEELTMIVRDRLSTLDRRWWKVLLLVAIASIPLFFILKYSFSAIFIGNYQPPVVTTDRPQPEPLQVIDRMIFDLGGSSYAGFVRIRNINLERGVPELSYNIKFKTVGSSLITEMTGRTFVLPASEKILSFPRFTSDQKPELVEVNLIEPKFLYKPQLPLINLELERIQIQRENGNLYLNAGVKNLSAFTVKEIYLPVLLYDSDNRIVGVNSTFINEVRSSEIRTFRFVWSDDIPKAIRAEINPEINVFDKNILRTEPGSVNLFNQSNESLAE